MRSALLSTVLGVGLLLAPAAFAQTSGVTATCKDGSTFSGATRSGACRGHRGVATWGTAAASPGIAPATAPPARSANAAPTSPPATIPNKTARGSSSTAAARTGAPGQVWVNSASKVYHCPGDRYYGKTKAGSFMSRSAAEAAGDRPAGGKTCAS